MTDTYVRFKYLWRPWTLPATVACSNRASGGKGASYHLSPRWRDAVRQINTPHANNYLFKDHSGWVNAMANDGTPIIERVAFAGNVAKVISFNRGYYLLDNLESHDTVPSPLDRFHVHRFTCIDPLMRPRQPGDGFDAFVFLLADGEMWVHQSNVEVFHNPPPPIFPATTSTNPTPRIPKRKRPEDRE